MADPKLTDVTIEFRTHNDNKDHDTLLSVAVINKVNLFLEQVIAQNSDLAHGMEFVDPSTNMFHLGVTAPIVVSQLTFPQTKIHIQPNGHDRWIFDFTVNFVFDSGPPYSYSKSGIVLDQDNKDYVG
jgi:hypothetical protein